MLRMRFALLAPPRSPSASRPAAAATTAPGGDDPALRRSGPSPRRAVARGLCEPAAPATEVDAADVRVVRAWADTLRRGDMRGAARFFALPSLVSNGTPPIKLETRAEARFFNRTLPCGAKLIGTEPARKGFFIATFRLTERPGKGECGSGTGETARTAFRIRDEHITDWLRVQDIDSAPDSLS